MYCSARKIQLHAHTPLLPPPTHHASTAALVKPPRHFRGNNTEICLEHDSIELFPQLQHARIQSYKDTKSITDTTGRDTPKSGLAFLQSKSILTGTRMHTHTQIVIVIFIQTESLQKTRLGLDILWMPYNDCLTVSL